jgi:maleate cis-trans isomerase
MMIEAKHTSHGSTQRPKSYLDKKQEKSEVALRRRIGLLVPSTNTVAEPDVHGVVPDGVTVHVHRMFLPDNVPKKDAMDRMNSDLEQGARYLSTAKVEIICMTGTQNSFYKGANGADWMEETMSKAAGVPGVASSPSVLQALRHFGARTLSVATPYSVWGNERLGVYLNENGFQPLNIDRDERIADGHPQHMNDLEPDYIRDYVLSVVRPEADAIFLPCAAWRVLEIAAKLEADTGKPVVTTNQATIWRTLRKLGLREAKAGFGRLLDEMPDPEDLG